jgi:hypothetical protein
MRTGTQCSGSKQKVDGPDESTGTVSCRVCGKCMLQMLTTTMESGEQKHSVPEHYAKAPAPRLKPRPKRPSLPSDKSRRNGRNRSRQ